MNKGLLLNHRKIPIYNDIFIDLPFEPNIYEEQFN